MNFNVRRNIACFLLIVLLTVSLTGCGTPADNENKPLSTNEKLEDFEYMYNLISENYPYLKVNERVNGINWLERKEEYKTRIENTDSDEMFINEITGIVQELNNGHTEVLDRETFAWMYPVIEKFNTNNNPWSEVLNNEKVLKRYNFTNEELDNIEPKDSPFDNSPAFSTDIIADEVAYLKIKIMNGNRIEEDGREIRKFYEKIKNYDKLIIDIRGNGGGSDWYWERNVVEPLAKEKISVSNYIFIRGKYYEKFYSSRGMRTFPVSNLNKNILSSFPEEIETDFDRYNISAREISPKNPIGFNGKIYLLIDNIVYSSSESFAVFCKSSGFATLVGGTTGGDGIGIDPFLFSLPNSGIVIRYSGEMALNGDGTINEEVHTAPDVEIDPAIGKTYEEDKAIQYVIADN